MSIRCAFRREKEDEGGEQTLPTTGCINFRLTVTLQVLDILPAEVTVPRIANGPDIARYCCSKGSQGQVCEKGFCWRQLVVGGIHLKSSSQRNRPELALSLDVHLPLMLITSLCTASPCVDEHRHQDL